MDGQRDGDPAVLPVASFLGEAALPCGDSEGLRIVNQGKYLALQPECLPIGTFRL